ncbi:hypothetical protein D3C76_1289720 [compost metagenome]
MAFSSEGHHIPLWGNFDLIWRRFCEYLCDLLLNRLVCNDLQTIFLQRAETWRHHSQCFFGIGSSRQRSEVVVVVKEDSHECNDVSLWNLPLADKDPLRVWESIHDSLALQSPVCFLQFPIHANQHGDNDCKNR